MSESILKILQIQVRVADKDLHRIPESGPVIFVANHPHGFLDGFALDHTLLKVRSDLKLLVNEMIAGLQGMTGRTIAVDVFSSRREQNVRAARLSMAWLEEQHSLLMFPAGEVSHWQREQKRIADGAWTNFAVRCARRTGAAIVPVFITGTNSMTFTLSGLLHPGFRTARLSAELFNKRSSTVEIRLGKPIQKGELAGFAGDTAATEYVRARVYLLAHRSSAAVHPLRRVIRLPQIPRRQRICKAAAGLADVIGSLRERSSCVLENEAYAVYSDSGKNIPEVLHEIGRLRELTFRDAGEGTGKSIDLDEFDSEFTHLVLCHKQSASIAGSYRLVWTRDLPSSSNVNGLYTSKLFRYAPEFLTRLGPAVELGRSFIVKEHQREVMPLLLLWQAIGHVVAKRPDSPVLFGAVSISSTYSETARAMMVQLLRQHNFRQDLDESISPRKPFVSRLIRQPELNTIARCLPDVQDLPIGDIDSQDGVPVLLRQYLRLGGKVAGFNLDAQFSNALDALLILDLRETPRRLLTKYMGADNAAKFLEVSSTSSDSATP